MWKAVKSFFVRLYRSAIVPVERSSIAEAPIKEEPERDSTGIVVKFRTKASIEHKDMLRRRKDFRQYKNFGQ